MTDNELLLAWALFLGALALLALFVALFEQKEDQDGGPWSSWHK